MKITKILFLMICMFSSVAYTQDISDSFKEMKEEVLSLYRQEKYSEATKRVKDFIDVYKENLDPRLFQATYLLYAETFSLQNSYQRAAEILKEAIDRYDSDLEPRLKENYKAYIKNSHKPKLDVDPEMDQLACELQGGLWQGPENGRRIIKKGYCNFLTTDYRRVCSDSSDCQGLCEVDSNIIKGTKTQGLCSKYLFTITGCSYTVTDGIADGGVCW